MSGKIETDMQFLASLDPSAVIHVTEDRICATMIEMLNVEGVVLEPAGALAIDALRDLDIRSMDVVEVSPPYDHADITAIAASTIVQHHIQALALKQGD